MVGGERSMRVVVYSGDSVRPEPKVGGESAPEDEITKKQAANPTVFVTVEIFINWIWFKDIQSAPCKKPGLGRA